LSGEESRRTETATRYRQRERNLRPGNKAQKKRSFQKRGAHPSGGEKFSRKEEPMSSKTHFSENKRRSYRVRRRDPRTKGGGFLLRNRGLPYCPKEGTLIRERAAEGQSKRDRLGKIRSVREGIVLAKTNKGPRIHKKGLLCRHGEGASGKKVVFPFS